METPWFSVGTILLSVAIVTPASAQLITSAEHSTSTISSLSPYPDVTTEDGQGADDDDHRHGPKVDPIPGTNPPSEDSLYRRFETWLYGICGWRLGSVKGQYRP